MSESFMIMEYCLSNDYKEISRAMSEIGHDLLPDMTVDNSSTR